MDGLFKVIDTKEIITLLIAFLGFCGIFLQLFLQNRSNLKLQRENKKITEKLYLYKDLEKLIKTYFDKSNEIGSYLYILKTMLIQVNQTFQATGQPPIAQISNADIFLGKDRAYRSTAFDIVLLVERRQIMEPRLEVCANALKSSLFDLNNCFIKLSELLIQNLPISLELNSCIWPQGFPNNTILDNIVLLIDQYINIRSDIDGYIYDTDIVSQNFLLGDLFENKAHYRKPIDQNIIALNFDKYSIDELNKYFLDKTPWGKHMKEINEEVYRSFINVK